MAVLLLSGIWGCGFANRFVSAAKPQTEFIPIMAAGRPLTKSNSSGAIEPAGTDAAAEAAVADVNEAAAAAEGEGGCSSAAVSRGSPCLKLRKRGSSAHLDVRSLQELECKPQQPVDDLSASSLAGQQLEHLQQLQQLQQLEQLEQQQRLQQMACSSLDLLTAVCSDACNPDPKLQTL